MFTKVLTEFCEETDEGENLIGYHYHDHMVALDSNGSAFYVGTPCTTDIEQVGAALAWQLLNSFDDFTN